MRRGAARELWAAPSGTGASYAGTRQRNLYWTAGGTLIFPWEATGWLHPYALDAAKGGVPRGLEAGAAREGFCQAALKTLRSLDATGALAAPKNSA